VSKKPNCPDEPEAFTENTGRAGDDIKRGLDAPAPEATETSGKDGKLEARRDHAEYLKLEERTDAVIDVELEARIERLESSGDLVEETREPARKAFSGSGGADVFDGVKVTSAKTEKGWYRKSPKTQRREIERICGTYRPAGDYRFLASVFRPWTLKDNLRDAKADAILTRADKAKTRPPKPPAPAPEPVAGYCRECHKALPRYGIRAGTTMFCQDNGGKCGKAFRQREANRDKLNRVFKDYEQSNQADRMLSIHHVAARSMSNSAYRCGIEATFTATVDGVLATHENPLPPIEHGVCVLGLEEGDGYVMLQVAIAATEHASGTLYKIEIEGTPEASSMHFGGRRIGVSFEGDSGESPPVSTVAPPAMSGSYAARNHRTPEYVAARKKSKST
jgi:hypothetical protein